MKRTLIGLIAVLLLTTGCAAAQETAQGLRDKIADIDIDATLDDLRDCDKLSETFVGLVGTAADAVDGLAERTNGRVPETDIRNAVDTIAVSKYFGIAERIGCAEIQQRLNTVNQLRELTPDTPAGEDFLEEILREVQTVS
jgi:hypothetical protein